MDENSDLPNFKKKKKKKKEMIFIGISKRSVNEELEKLFEKIRKLWKEKRNLNLMRIIIYKY